MVEPGAVAACLHIINASMAVIPVTIAVIVAFFLFDAGLDSYCSADRVAQDYFGSLVERDGRTMLRFATRDDAVAFISNVSMLTERHTNILRDGLIDRMRRAGIAVNTDWQEGERVLAQENGRVTMMGSRVEKKQIAISRYFEDKELTEKQRAFVDVYSGKEKESSIEYTTPQSQTSDPMLLRQ